MICKAVEVILRIQWRPTDEEFNEDKRPVLESLGVDGGGLGVPGGQGEHLGDPMGPSGWFDESSDDSWGI